MQEKNISIDSVQLNEDINTISLTDLIDTIEISPQLPLFSADLCDNMSQSLDLGLAGPFEDTITLTSTIPSSSYTNIATNGNSGITTGNFFDFDLNQYNDITIQRRSDRSSIQVGELLERIAEAYCIPIVSQADLDSNPMLKDAFEAWKKSIKVDPDVVKAYEQFQLIQTLCRKDLAAKW